MKRIVVAVAVLFCAVSAFAADGAKTQFTVFTTNIGYAESSVSGSHWSGGFGFALSHDWTSRWSTELAISQEQHRAAYATSFASDAAGHVLITRETRSFTVFPVDVTTRYQFTNSSRWTPYVSAGLRYVDAPSTGTPAVFSVTTPGGPVFMQTGFGFQPRTSAQLGAGTLLRITPRFGLRFDVNRLLRSEGVNYDPLTRTSLGVSWRF